MNKEELYSLGYIYENGASGTIGVNYEVFRGLPESYLIEFIAYIKTIISKSNYTRIINGFSKRGIGRDIFEYRRKTGENEIRIIKHIGDDLYESVALCINIEPTDEKAIFIKKLEGIESRTFFDIEAVDRLIIKARFDMNTKVSIDLTISNLMQSSSTVSHFDNYGLRYTCSYRGDELVCRLDKEGYECKKTFYANHRKDKVQIMSYDDKGHQTLSSTRYAYNDNNQLIYFDTLNSIKSNNEYKPFSKVRKYIDYIESDVFRITKIDIKDIKYGIKSITVKPDALIFDDNTKRVIYPLDEPFSVQSNTSLDKIASVLLAEGCLRQLHKDAPEVLNKIDYNNALEHIYELKLEYVKSAVEDKEVIIYIGDKGNITIYDREGSRAAYFPANILNKVIPDPKILPNTMVEQNIKEGNNGSLIKQLYWLGTREGEGKGIYAFHRCIKAFSKNPATPTEVLDDIVDRIIDGQYDETNLVFIASNPSTSRATLEKIYHDTSSVLVKSRVNMSMSVLDEHESLSDIGDRILAD